MECLTACTVVRSLRSQYNTSTHKNESRRAYSPPRVSVWAPLQHIIEQLTHRSTNCIIQNCMRLLNNDASTPTCNDFIRLTNETPPEYVDRVRVCSLTKRNHLFWRVIKRINYTRSYANFAEYIATCLICIYECIICGKHSANSIHFVTNSRYAKLLC